MLGIMAALKDKPDWEQKVFDPIITEKWKSEAVEGSNLMKQALEDDASEDELEEWLNMNATPRQRVVTQKLFNYVCCFNCLTMAKAS